MASTKNGKNRNGKRPGHGQGAGRASAGFKLPPQVPAIMAIMAAAVVLVALLSSSPTDPSVMGRAGFRLASVLTSAFGLGAFWPIPALAGLAYLSFKRIRLTQPRLLKTIGWVLFLFASLAFLSLLSPGTGGSPGGGGAFGLFLSRAVTEFLGRVGAALILPLVAGLGVVVAVPALGRQAVALVKINLPWGRPHGDEGEEEPAPRPRRAKADPGLEAEPTDPAPVRSAPAPAPVIVEKPAKKPAPVPAAASEPARPAPGKEPGGPYRLPPADLLDNPPPDRVGHASGLSDQELTDNAHLLEDKLRDFGVEGRVLEVSGGPVITMYEYQPAPGIKISKVAGLSDDLTMAMRAISIRVVAPLPGKAALGIEIPNPKRGLVSFKEVVESPAFRDNKSLLSLVLGVDIMGAPVVADLAKMPHLLIAGATGSGKSVGLGAMIMSILHKASPDEVRFLMIDPKCVELALYKDIPHLIYPVLSDPAEATLGLKWAVAEMDLRYKLLAEKGVRNIETYNDKIRAELKELNRKARRGGEAGAPARERDEQEPPRELPFLVIIIDELADLMMVSAKEVEVYITRLAQKARAAGIHLILATQRPSVDVLTGIIKANMPTRISFQVSSRIDSRTILDQMGAEKLLGAGDMLFLPPGVGKLRRLHGAFVSDDEIKRVTDFIRQWGPPDYLEDLSLPEAEGGEDGEGERDEKYDEAVELVRRTQKATISHVQRHLRIGYNRAARIIEDMEREGIIGPQDGTRPRAIF